MRLIRDGEKGGTGVWRWGKREIIYLSLHCHHQNDFCIKVGSDEGHLNVSVGSDGQSHKTVSANHNLFEEKGEPSAYLYTHTDTPVSSPIDYQPLEDPRLWKESLTHGLFSKSGLGSVRP